MENGINLQTVSASPPYGGSGSAKPCSGLRAQGSILDFNAVFPPQFAIDGVNGVYILLYAMRP